MSSCLFTFKRNYFSELSSEKLNSFIVQQEKYLLDYQKNPNDCLCRDIAGAARLNIPLAKNELYLRSVGLTYWQIESIKMRDHRDGFPEFEKVITAALLGKKVVLSLNGLQLKVEIINDIVNP